MDTLNFIFQLAAAVVVIAVGREILGKAGRQVAAAIIRKAMPLIRAEIRKSDLGLPVIAGSNDNGGSDDERH